MTTALVAICTAYAIVLAVGAAVFVDIGIEVRRCRDERKTATALFSAAGGMMVVAAILMAMSLVSG